MADQVVEELPAGKLVLPKSPCCLSNSASSASNRRSWADVTDDDSDDEMWTPMPPYNHRGMTRSGLALQDTNEDAVQFSGYSPLATFEALLRKASGQSQVSQSAPSHGIDELRSAGHIGPSEMKEGRNKVRSSSYSWTQEDDARFWAEASSTAASSSRASSGSERPNHRATTPAWSLGAELHASGSCHPCIFYPKAIGCDNGRECPFCHLDHASRSRHRRRYRRGHGRGDAGSESKEDSDIGMRSTEQSDIEEVAFMLPSALLWAQTAWRESPGEASK